MNGVISQTQTERVLLCGDAAGFVNGLTGEGIYYAMVSGDLAAQTLVQAFRQKDFRASRLARYQRAWQTEIGAELTQSVQLQKRVFTNMRFANVLVHMVNKQECLKKVFTDYFMGKMTYRTLKHFLIFHFLPQYLKLRMMSMFYHEEEN